MSPEARGCGFLLYLLETNEVIQQLNLSQVSKIIGALKVGGIVNSIPCQSQRLEPIVDVRELVYVEEGRQLLPQINALTQLKQFTGSAC